MRIIVIRFVEIFDKIIGIHRQRVGTRWVPKITKIDRSKFIYYDQEFTENWPPLESH